jgi:glutathione S-transferase
MTAAADRLTLVGRSSSHFTRVTRIFASELGVPYTFEILRDIQSREPDDYAGNPALKLPVLQSPRGVWFGASNICRELARSSDRDPKIVWPEALDVPLAANAQELVLQAMTTEVGLIMGKAAGDADDHAHHVKMRESLTRSLSWLEENARFALAALPAWRDLSYLEVTLFCLLTHLPFRDILPTSGYAHLSAFCEQFAARPSAVATAYRFDS